MYRLDGVTPYAISSNAEVSAAINQALLISKASASVSASAAAVGAVAVGAVGASGVPLPKQIAGL